MNDQERIDRQVDIGDDLAELIESLDPELAMVVAMGVAADGLRAAIGRMVEDGRLHPNYHKAYRRILVNWVDEMLAPLPKTMEGAIFAEIDRNRASNRARS